MKYSDNQSNGTHGRSTHPCWPELVLRYAVRSWRAKYWPKPLKNHQYMSKSSRDVIFSGKKAPAGCSTTNPRAFTIYLEVRSTQASSISHVFFKSTQYAAKILIINIYLLIVWGSIRLVLRPGICARWIWHGCFQVIKLLSQIINHGFGASLTVIDSYILNYGDIF